MEPDFNRIANNMYLAMVKAFGNPPFEDFERRELLQKLAQAVKELFPDGNL